MNKFHISIFSGIVFGYSSVSSVGLFILNAIAMERHAITAIDIFSNFFYIFVLISACSGAVLLFLLTSYANWSRPSSHINIAVGAIVGMWISIPFASNLSGIEYFFVLLFSEVIVGGIGAAVGNRAGKLAKNQGADEGQHYWGPD